MLGTERASVVHGDGGLDELALSGASDVATVAGTDGDARIERRSVMPEDVGLSRAPLAALAGGDAEANAAILRAVFGGEPGPRRDVVLLNAGELLVIAGRAATLREGVSLAAATVDAGSVVELVKRLRR